MSANTETTTTETPQLADLDKVLEQMIKAEGEDPTLAPNFKREWKSREKKNQFVWQHPDFGRFVVEVKDFEFTTIEQGDTNLRARLPQGIRPNNVQLWFYCTAAPGVKVLHYQGGVETVCTDSPVPGLNVPVQWKKPTEEPAADGADKKEKGREVPHTRVTGKDNADIILLSPSGKFVQLQVSVTTRRGAFWASLQEGYIGQIVRTTMNQAQKLKLVPFNIGGVTGTVVPASAEHAYPTSNFLRVHQGMGPKIMKQAIESKASVQLSRCPVAKWEPQPATLTDELVQRGWKIGHPAYYNLVTGTGVIINENGETVFVHFSKVEDQNGVPMALRREFPVLEPLQAVMFKAKPGGQGLAATAVCAIESESNL